MYDRKRAWAQDREILRLAGPCIMENLSSTMVGFVDAAMIGALGAEATAAVGVVAPFTWLVGGVVSSIGVGGTAVVARLIGGKNDGEARRVTGQVFWMAAALSALMTLLVVVCAPLIPAVMQADGALHRDCVAYLRCLALGYIPCYTGMVMGALLRGAGDTRTPMVSGLLANAVNVVLNFFMIYEPRFIAIGGGSLYVWGAGLGVEGAALASALANAFSGVYILLHMRRKKTRLRLEIPPLKRVQGSVWARVLRIGTPAALERVAVNLGQMLFASMISSLGVAEIAAHSLAIEIEGLGYMPAYGFGAAATTLVGMRLGEGDREGARYVGKRAATLAVLLLIAVGAGTFVFAPQLIALFTPDERVRAIGASLICICSFEQPFNALNNVLSGALRGAGDTRMPLVYSFVSMWLVRILLSWLLGICLGGGIYVIWWCMVADLGVRGALMAWRFHQGKWADIRV